MFEIKPLIILQQLRVAPLPWSSTTLELLLIAWYNSKIQGLVKKRLLRAVQQSLRKYLRGKYESGQENSSASVSAS